LNNTHNKLLLLGGFTGAVYGLGIRGLLEIHWSQNSKWLGPLLWVMSIAFIAVVPFAMGYLSIAVEARQFPVSIKKRIFVPWIVVLISLAISGAVLWEGMICIVMLAPIALLCASLGGLVAGYLVKPARPQMATISMLIVAMLPFCVGRVEHRLGGLETRSVESEIVIQAPAEAVWQNIERVPTIDAKELPISWNRSIGFPSPVEASLDHEGLGGVRHATFSGGVLFIETVDVWQPLKRLGFSIHADSDHISSKTLDEHVKVGGAYFDVLHGEYILEPRAQGGVRLRLVSRHRLSTDFNWYARLWSDAVMRDVQKSILQVVRKRCESGGLSQSRLFLK
jgi:hypothetical protein